MKSRLLIISILTAAASYSAAAQTNTMKKTMTDNKVQQGNQRETAFGIAVLKALQARDSSAWIALFPTNAEYGGILQAGLAAKAEGLTQQIIDDILVRRNKEAAAAYAKQYNHYLSMADSLGISWADVVFQKLDYKFVYPDPVKLKYLDAILRFRCKEQNFVIDGVQAVEIGTGYRLQAVGGIDKDQQPH